MQRARPNAIFRLFWDLGCFGHFLGFLLFGEARPIVFIHLFFRFAFSVYFLDWPLVPKTCSPLFFLAQAYCFHDVFFFLLLFGFLLIEISHFWHFLPKNFWAGPAQVELDAENSQVFFFTFLL